MKPNIIILVIDALRPKNLSLYGCEREKDRNIKKIGSESIVFNQHFSTSNSSYPSLTTIFSSFGILDKPPVVVFKIRPSDPTIQPVLVSTKEKLL